MNNTDKKYRYNLYYIFLEDKENNALDILSWEKMKKYLKPYFEPKDINIDKSEERP